MLIEKDIHLNYTEELTKKSVLYYSWSITGHLFVTALILLVLCLVFLIQYDGSSLVITLITFTLIIVPSFLGMIYYITRRRALDKFRKLEDGKVLFGITEDYFSIKVGQAITRLPWTSISRIHQYDEFWVVILRPTGYFTLPTYNLMQEDKDFILGKVVRRRKTDRGLFPRERRA